MRILSILFFAAAVIVWLKVLFLIVVTLIYGETNILLPGLGLVINVWAIIYLLLFFAAALTAVAFLTRRLAARTLD